MKRLVTLGIILAVGASTAIAQVGASSGGAAQARTRGPNTLVMLNQRVPETSFEEAPLETVMDWIAEFAQMNVVVRWNMLEDQGISKDKPVSITVRNLSLSQVLWMIMTEAGGSDVKLAYRASGNLLILSTEEDLSKEMIIKVYDVSDLLVRIQSFYGAPQLDLTQQQQSGGSGGGGGQNIFGNSSGGNQDDNRDNNDEDDANILELIQLIVNVIEPDSWADNGGLGTIQPFNKQLVIRNNILVHQRLGGNLTEGE